MVDVVVPGGDPVKIVVVPHVRCRELDGAHFDTDKSFVRPDGLPMIAQVNRLLAADANRRALIFGHTDTVGPEGYNKKLSEKRARSVFAALVHDPAVWEELYNKESWGIARTQTMLEAVRDPDDPAPSSSGFLDQPTIAAVKRFQNKHPPLDPDGDPGPKTRRELFLAYFKKVAENPADATRFVVLDGSPFMGCGEYNPFTEGAADEASRRVVVQVFDRSAEPANLPCKMGDIGPCRANLLAPGESPPADDPPKMAHFRCKVFRGIERRCNSRPPVPPIVKPGLTNGNVSPVPTDGDAVKIKVLDLGRQPVKATDVTVEATNFRTFAATDQDGVLAVTVPKGTTELTLNYMPPDTAFLVTCKVKRNLPPVSDDAGAVARLVNLGYPADTDRSFAIYSFQKDHDLDVTLVLDSATRSKLAEVHGS